MTPNKDIWLRTGHYHYLFEHLGPRKSDQLIEGKILHIFDSGDWHASIGEDTTPDMDNSRKLELWEIIKYRLLGVVL